MRVRTWLAAVAGMALAGTIGAAGLRGASGAAKAGPAAAAIAPCGGEQLAEDSFPPAFSPAAPAVAPEAARASSGGSGDAPGGPDGRPETFTPDAPAFDAVLRREDATVRMSSFETGFTHASASQAANIALVAKKLAGVIIPKGAVFSYNRAAGPFTAAGGYGWGRMFVGERIVPTIGGGVCQGASTLYNVVLLANLPVVERHRHGLTVPYLPPGRDATVTESGGLDFRFRNDTPGPLVLWAQAKDRRLSIAIYGRVAPPKVTVETEVVSRTPFRTEVINDRELPPGTEQVAAAGQDGARSRTWVVVDGPGGPVRRYLGEDSYRPSPRVILRGPAGRASGGRSGAATA